ncbi:hypothetical protein ACNOYE_05595 [Nannocystaceae bacterium ST9]
MTKTRLRILITGLLAFLCSTAHADDPTHVAMTSLPTCDNSYDVVGTVHDRVESESIDGDVFTDLDPFECELASANQTVDFNFNGASTDSVTGCTYTLVRRDKATGAPLGATETLDCVDNEITFEVIATPLSSDPDCSGLSVIEVDPKVHVTWGKGGSTVCPN